MRAHDFGVLNDKEFEELAIDLIEADHGVSIERFKPGKDQGIDGRFYRYRGSQNVIIQCKHFMASGFPLLYRHFRDCELPKLTKLTPCRYIVATSVPLSPSDKDRLKDLLSDYVKDTGDILGNDELQARLRSHPEVERAHYKLWICSTTVLATVLHNDVTGRAEVQLEDFRSFQPKYAATQYHQTAQKHLEDHRVLILTGEPGIGKTTLAKALCFQYAASGYETVFIEESCAEGERVFRPDAKQIFYFDDFLGTNYLLALSRDSESHIVNFINRIGRDPRKRFILTSRTNIFNQAYRLTDEFRAHNVRKTELELQVTRLSDIDKARILYNHVWFSRLDPKFIDELYTDARYLEIVKHRNFSPRLISFLTDIEKVRDIPAARYWTHVQAILRAPKDIWRRAFDSQLDSPGRMLVLLVVFGGGKLSEATLSRGYECLRKKGLVAQSGTLRLDFDPNVRSVTGAFLLRDLDATTRIVRYRPFSPSLADYVLASYAGHTDLLTDLLSCLMVPAALRTLRSMEKADVITGETYKEILWALMDRVGKPDRTQMSWAIHLWHRLIDVDELPSDRGEAIARMAAEIPIAEVTWSAVFQALQLYQYAIEKKVVADPGDFVANVISSIDIKILDLDDYDALTTLCKCGRLSPRSEQGRQLNRAIVDTLCEGADEMAREDDRLSEMFDVEEEDYAMEVYRDSLSDWVVAYDGFVDDADIDEIVHSVNYSNLIRENQERAMYEDHQADMAKEARGTMPTGDGPIHDLFDRT